MKTSLFSILFLFACAFGRDTYPRQLHIDALHYTIRIGVSNSTDSITATAGINFLFKKSNVKEIRLDLASLKVNQVLENGDPTTFQQSGDELHVALNGSYKEGEEIFIVIFYEGRPSDGLIIGKNKFGNRTFFADNWPNRAHNWFPCIDHPYDKATVDFFVTAPEVFKVVASGILKDTLSISGSKIWHWSESVPIPTYCMVFGAAEFSVSQQGIWDGIPVTNYVYPADSAKGAVDFSHGLKILEYFSNLIGPYSYEKLALVQSTTRFGGMENAGNIFFAERAFNGTGRLAGTVAHEIAHQWFGDAVTEADWHHLWLSEGFASYFGPLYFEHLFGKDTLKYFMRREKEGYFRSQVVNRPLYDTTMTDLNRLLNSNNYNKGSWVLHMLRGLMGDDKFFAGIREYYKTYRNNNALTEDFQAVMERHARQKLDWFFRQWIYGAGYPKLDVVWKWDNGRKECTLQIAQKQDGIVFRLPLEIEFRNENSSQREKIAVDKKEQAFSFKTKFRPFQVIIDPDDWILKELTTKAE